MEIVWRQGFDCKITVLSQATFLVIKQLMSQNVLSKCDFEMYDMYNLAYHTVDNFSNAKLSLTTNFSQVILIPVALFALLHTVSFTKKLLDVSTKFLSGCLLVEVAFVPQIFTLCYYLCNIKLIVVEYYFLSFLLCADPWKWWNFQHVPYKVNAHFSPIQLFFTFQNSA